ncbi:MAG: EutP/PduV family microcompartment system protein [Cloacibacillus evryensis]
MAGKTTLTQAMMREELRYRKTQTLDIVGGFIIDTPGEYLGEGRPARAPRWRPRRLGSSYFSRARPPYRVFPAGVRLDVRQAGRRSGDWADIASPEEIEEAKRRLARAGVKRVFVTSAYTGEGIQEFIDFIDSLD